MRANQAGKANSVNGDSSAGGVLSQRTRSAAALQQSTAAPSQSTYEARLRSVESVVGTSAEVARILGVDRSRVSRWHAGKETPGPRAARELIDLDHVIARARLVLHEDAIGNWLNSANLHLNGATPLSRLRSGHADEAITALEAFEEGAYA